MHIEALLLRFQTKILSVPHLFESYRSFRHNYCCRHTTHFVTHRIFNTNMQYSIPVLRCIQIWLLGTGGGLVISEHIRDTMILRYMSLPFTYLLIYLALICMLGCEQCSDWWLRSRQTWRGGEQQQHGFIVSSTSSSSTCAAADFKRWWRATATAHHRSIVVDHSAGRRHPTSRWWRLTTTNHRLSAVHQHTQLWHVYVMLSR